MNLCAQCNLHEVQSIVTQTICRYEKIEPQIVVVHVCEGCEQLYRDSLNALICAAVHMNHKETHEVPKPIKTLQ